MPCVSGQPLIYIPLGAFYLAIATTFLTLRLKNPNRPFTLWQFTLLLLILVGPPAWFDFQFHLLYLSQVPQQLRGRDICDAFKYSQDLASKIWAAVSALVLLVALRKEPA